MDDPYWPGYPPERKPPSPEGLKPIPSTAIVEKVSSPPGMLLPALGVPWGLIGPLLLGNMAHFGFGFLPGMVWIWSLPFLWMKFVAGAVVNVFSFRSWSTAHDASLRLFCG